MIVTCGDIVVWYRLTLQMGVDGMKVVVFGGSGRTGRRVVESAVEAGHDVRAVSRSAAAPEQASGQVEWVRCDILDREEVGTVVAGVDAVISAVGIGSSRHETTTYSVGARNIATAMSTSRGTRLAVVSAAPVGIPGKAPLAYRVTRRVLWAVFGPSYRDMTRMEAELDAWPDLDWVALRPPYLRDAPATGRYRIDPDRPVPGGNSLTTGDLAAALLDSITQSRPSWHTAYIAN